MQTKTGNNNYDLCSALKGYELTNSISIECKNESRTRKYIITGAKKALIRNGLASKGYTASNISWIGESRTKLTSGDLLPFGYSSFISED